MGLSQSVRNRRTGWADMLVMLGLVGLSPPTSAQISIAPQSGQPGDTVSVPVIFADAGAPISAVQLDLSYPAGVSLSAAPGNALQTASKTIYSADITSSQKLCLPQIP